MSYIPSEIVADFLSRVPARSLLRFRCVSKSWLAIIDSQDFIKIHLNRTIQTNSERKLILRRHHTGCLYMVDFDALERTNKADYLELDHPLKRPCMGTKILGYCHGLLCLENSQKDIVLWNPTTRKHFKLPSSDIDNEFRKDSVYGSRLGFGYDKVSDDYKVLRILQSYDAESEVKVFSMKSKCWRKLPCFPYYYPKHIRAHAHRNLRAQAVLAGGALHWVVSKNPFAAYDLGIAAFDLGTEEYKLLPLPDDFKNEFETDMVVLGESLCLMCTDYNSKCDIWVMKEYAVKESWTKLFTVDIETKNFDGVIPLAYSISGHHVFLVKDEQLLLQYDLKKRKISDSMFSIPEFNCYFMEHYMSFGSLVQLDGGISDNVGYAKGRKRGKGSQDTKKSSKKKRDGFMLRAST